MYYTSFMIKKELSSQNYFKYLNYINYENHHQVAGIIYSWKIKNFQDIRLSDEYDYYEWLSQDDLHKMNKWFYPKMKNWDWNNLSLHR